MDYPIRDRVFGATALAVSVPLILFTPSFSWIVCACFFALAAILELDRVIEHRADDRV